MVAQTETGDLAEKVALAMFGVTLERPDKTAWDGLDEDTQAAFLVGAHAAIAANAKWLAVNGYRIIPPGVTPVPSCQEEADAMMAAIARFNVNEARKPKKLIGLNGRAL